MGFKNKNSNWALKHYLQNYHQVATAMDSHLSSLGWSPTNPRMVTHQKEKLQTWNLELKINLKTAKKWNQKSQKSRKCLQYDTWYMLPDNVPFKLIHLIWYFSCDTRYLLPDVYYETLVNRFVLLVCDTW